MDLSNLIKSPMSSPSNTVYSVGPYFDTTSESSNPNSPRSQQIGFMVPMSSDSYNYRSPQRSYHPQPVSRNIQIEYSPITLDEEDRTRRKSSVSSKGTEKDASSMHMRRRAQNRASQRAFRERKDRHVKSLETQLEELHEQHQDLLQSYNKQADEVIRLTSQINTLAAELQNLRTAQESYDSNQFTGHTFDVFDAFSSMDTMYQPAEYEFDRTGIGREPEFVLHTLGNSP